MLEPRFRKCLRLRSNMLRSVDSLNETPERPEQEATGVKFKLWRRLQDFADVNTETLHDKTYHYVKPAQKHLIAAGGRNCGSGIYKPSGVQRMST